MYNRCYISHKCPGWTIGVTYHTDVLDGQYVLHITQMSWMDNRCYISHICHGWTIDVTYHSDVMDGPRTIGQTATYHIETWDMGHESHKSHGQTIDVTYHKKAMDG